MIDDEICGEFVDENTLHEETRPRGKEMISEDKEDENVDVILEKDVLEKKIDEAVAPIKITDYAYDKANYIASKTKELCEELSLPTYEVAFYLLTTKEEAKNSNPVIRDIFLAYEQDVNPIECKMTAQGALRSRREIIKRTDKRIAGWGHSHGDMGVFFSGTDWRTFESFIDNYKMFIDIESYKKVDKTMSVQEVDGKTYLQISDPVKEDATLLLAAKDDVSIKNLENLVESELEFFKEEHQKIPYSYALVFNASNSKPFSVLGYDLGGQKEYVENIALEKIEDGKLSERDKKEIEHGLKERVIQIRDKITEIGDEVNKDYQKVKTTLDSARKIIDRDFYDERGEFHYPSFENLSRRIGYAEKKIDTYRNREDFAVKNTPVVEKMEQEFQDFQKYVVKKSNHLEFLKSQVDTLISQYPKTKFLLPKKKDPELKRLERMSEIFESFIDMGKNYRGEVEVNVYHN